jgi:hypothetical protein
MHEGASALKAWETFYVIVGSASGALTGLQFVVMTLIAEAGPMRGRKEAIAAFGTPNVVHFCAGLLVASILSAPWRGLLYAGLGVAGCGTLGVIYSAVVIRRARRQRAYEPVFEDWLWHTILPLLAYAVLFVTGVMLEWSSTDVLFVLGAAVLLLVFIGIHNAWDTVTYMTAQRERMEQEEELGAVAGPAAPAAPAVVATAGAAGPGPRVTAAAAPGPGPSPPGAGVSGDAPA